MREVTKLPDNDKGEAGRRLHLRDITNDLPAAGERVGATLRTARMRCGEDLQAVAEALRIRRIHLEALEEGDHDALPGRPYAIGFVRSYAEHLNLDPTEMVALYKAETEENGHEEMVFPEADDETRLPRGSLLVLGLLLAAGVYGGWLLSISADRNVAERVPPVPQRLEPQLAEPGAEVGQQSEVATRQTAGVSAQDTAPAQLTGDAAAASTTPTAARSQPPAAAAAPEIPAREAPAAGAAPTTGAAVPAEVTVAALEPPSQRPLAQAAARAVDGARIYGSQNGDGRVVIRARAEDAWIRVEDREANVLIEETLRKGDTYRAPNRDGLILVARDAGALEIVLDGQSVGAAGPQGLVLTGKSLDISDLSSGARR